MKNQRFLSSQLAVYHVVPPSVPDFKQEAYWDCTGEFLLKIRNW